MKIVKHLFLSLSLVAAPLTGMAQVGQDQSTQNIVISDVKITPDIHTADVTWKTNVMTQGHIQILGAPLDIRTELEPIVGVSEFRTDHHAFVTGLQADTEFRIALIADDQSGNKVTSVAYTFRTLAADGSSPSQLVISAIRVTPQETTADVSWHTNVPTKGHVDLLNSSADSAHETSFSRDHNARLTGLTADTTYQFNIFAVDENGREQTSPTQSFMTKEVSDDDDEDEDGPAIRNVRVTPRRDSALIRFNTDERAEATVRYFPANDPDDETVVDVKTLGVRGLRHMVTLRDLTPGTDYRFEITAIDDDDNETVSDEFTFRTRGAQPDESQSRILFSVVLSRDEDSARILWITNRPSDSRVWVTKNATVDTSVTPSASSSELSNVHVLEVTGLESNTTYNYVFKSTDGDGRVLTSEPGTFVTR